MAWRLLAWAGEREGRPIALRKPAQATVQGHYAASMCCSHAISSRTCGGCPVARPIRNSTALYSASLGAGLRVSSTPWLLAGSGGLLPGIEGGM